jgi:hypothetical protein
LELKITDLNCSQMSYLDTFYVSHFEEKNKYICMTEKGLMLDKADFSKKGYEMDEDQFPRNLKKVASTSGRDKQNIDVVMLDDDSNDDAKVEGKP